MSNDIKTIDNRFSLEAACIYDAKTEYKDEFVGIKYENGQLRIFFPLGFTAATTDEQRRKDVLNLIGVLTAFGDSKDSFIENVNYSNKTEVKFPVHAYLYIIRDFLTNGYYSEKEVVYTKSQNGKINWAKTIKKIRPQLINEQPLYLQFITRKTNYKESELITLIHQYCVYESFVKFGWIFSSFVPQKPSLSFNRALFLAVIKMKMSQTFNENNMMLFNSMIEIIDYLDKSKETKNFYYGTQEFEYIWEGMVDSVFGEKNKKKFYPHCHWEIEGMEGFDTDDVEYSKTAMRPDSIMITNKNTEEQKIFVLDSKYYKFGITNQRNHLPMSGSIIKQIAYAEYIEQKEASGGLKNKSKAIYNAFIMPFNSNGGETKMLCKGNAWTDYKPTVAGKSYYRIRAILLDTKYLIEHHTRNLELINQLAKIIEN